MPSKQSIIKQHRRCYVLYLPVKNPFWKQCMEQPRCLSSSPSVKMFRRSEGAYLLRLRETCCYCTKTNRINLTSRGSGAETSLTTAAGRSDCCTLPNQATFWKCCHFWLKKKSECENRVFRCYQNTRKEKESKASLLFFKVFIFQVSLCHGVCKKQVIQGKCRLYQGFMFLRMLLFTPTLATHSAFYIVKIHY